MPEPLDCGPRGPEQIRREANDASNIRSEEKLQCKLHQTWIAYLVHLSELRAV